MPGSVHPKGKHYVTTEKGELLYVAQGSGKLLLPTGEFVQVKRAFVDAATNDTTALLAAVADRAFRILSLILLHGDTAGTVTLKSGEDAISPVFSNAANGGMVLPLNPHGWFQTNAINEALNITVSDSSNCGVIINYIEIPQECFDLL